MRADQNQGSFAYAHAQIDSRWCFMGSILNIMGKEESWIDKRVLAFKGSLASMGRPFMAFIPGAEKPLLKL